MTDLTDQETAIIRETNRAIRWRPYTRAIELFFGVGLTVLAFWAANDRAVFDWLTGSPVFFGMLGGIGAVLTMGAIRDWSHRRDKLLIKLDGARPV